MLRRPAVSSPRPQPNQSTVRRTRTRWLPRLHQSAFSGAPEAVQWWPQAVGTAPGTVQCAMSSGALCAECVGVRCGYHGTHGDSWRFTSGEYLPALVARRRRRNGLGWYFPRVFPFFGYVLQSGSDSVVVRSICLLLFVARFEKFYKQNVVKGCPPKHKHAYCFIKHDSVTQTFDSCATNNNRIFVGPYLIDRCNLFISSLFTL